MHCDGSFCFTVDGCSRVAELCECQHRQISDCSVLTGRLMKIKHFDLLIRNSQIAAIAENIPHTGNWEEAPFVRTYREDYLQPPPRVFERTDGTFSIKVSSKEAVRLLVDPHADGRVGSGHFLIEAPAARCSVLFYSNQISTPPPRFLQTSQVC